MDGGVRSVASADLAVGSWLVVIVAALPSSELPARLTAEIAAIEAAGCRIVAVMLDAASEAAVGPDRMDETRQSLVFEAGLRQGRTAAGDVAERIASGVQNGESRRDGRPAPMPMPRRR